MTIQLEDGKFYRTTDDRKIGPMRFLTYEGVINFSASNYDLKENETIWGVGVLVFSSEGKCWTNNRSQFDIVAEWVDEPAKEALEILTKAENETRENFKQALYGDDPRIDLAIAYPLADDTLGFTLTVQGKPQKYTMKRSAAASFAGIIAEALAKC